MIKMKFLIILTSITLSIVSTEISAQNGGFAGASTRLGLNPKTMAMSNAMTASTSQGIYGYYNPALAALYSDNTQLDISIASLKYDRVYQTLGASFKIPPNAGLSINLIRTGVNNIDGRSLSGYPTEQFNTSEYQLLAAFGIQLSEKLNAGLGFKVNYADLNDDLPTSLSVGIDIGFLYKISPNLNAGFAVQDIFSEYSWESSELYGTDQARKVINKFPTRIKWGLSYHNTLFTASVDYEIQAYTSDVRETENFVESGKVTIIESISTLNTNSQQLRVGGAWNAHERFTLRTGYQLPDLADSKSWGASAGFSVYLPFDKYSPSIDYAFVIEPNQISNMHVFSLSLKL